MRRPPFPSDRLSPHRTRSIATQSTMQTGVTSVDSQFQFGAEIDDRFRECFERKNVLYKTARVMRRELIKPSGLALDQSFLENTVRGIVADVELVLKAKTMKASKKERKEANIPWKTRLTNSSGLLDEVNKLGKELQKRSGEVEIRTKARGNIGVAYNRSTGLEEWQNLSGHGVCGVYNPTKQAIKWKKAPNVAISGAFNKASGEVEFYSTEIGSICAVYNEHYRRVECKINDYGSVAGVYDPNKRKVVWEETHDFGATSLTGYFDLNMNEAVFDAYKGKIGVTCLYKTKDDEFGANFTTCCTNTVFLAEDVEIVDAYQV